MGATKHRAEAHPAKAPAHGAKLGIAAMLVLLCACADDEAIPVDAPPIVVDAAEIDTAVIDTPIDTAVIDADVRCMACDPSQVCVQFFNGTCGDGHVECQTRGAGCTGTACSADCQFWHCGAQDAGIYTCAAAPCPGEAPDALHCYGP